mgnify:CR=1 FL=1
MKAITIPTLEGIVIKIYSEEGVIETLTHTHTGNNSSSNNNIKLNFGYRIVASFQLGN